MSDGAERLASAIRAIRALLRPSPPPPETADPVARLDYLDQQVREVRTRVNALFFTVLAVALGDLVSRLVAP